MPRTISLLLCLPMLLVGAANADWTRNQAPEIFRQDGADSMTYVVDPSHSSLGFEIRHLDLSNLTGRFARFTGKAAFRQNRLIGLDFIVQTESLMSGQRDSDQLLLSQPMLNAGNFPNLTFQGTEIVQEDDRVRICGKLSLRGATREVTFSGRLGGFVDFPELHQLRSGLTLETTLSRQEFGLVYAETAPRGQAVLGDELKLSLNLQVVRSTRVVLPGGKKVPPPPSSH